ncbi:2852_t:CDS:2 [Funneliformis caledonium]|uniref:2852_t:CDS:1 n=1 Tax=Funneliformis caledonium TaxID=1117310 RepID=A0A9N8YT39_9GLOM|nr:2852_t:CDS:2 [Funneliformis caledonium]
MALEQKFVDQLSDENEEDFDADKVDSKNQEVSLLSIPIKEANEPVYRLNPTNTTSSDQFTATSITCLDNCFPDETLRIEAIFLQDVISVQKSNKVGRRKLGVKSFQIAVTSTSHSNIENSNQAISDQLPIDSRKLVNQDEPPRKKQRQYCETKPEEKKLLEPLLTCSEYPTSNQLDQVKETLGDEWDKNRICGIANRIKCYRRAQKAKPQLLLDRKNADEKKY